MNELPELPVKHVTREDVTGAVLWESVEGPYSAEDMRSYALSAVQMERERCARICEAEASQDKDRESHYFNVGVAACAAAIRSPSKEGS